MSTLIYEDPITTLAMTSRIYSRPLVQRFGIRVPVHVQHSAESSTNQVPYKMNSGFMSSPGSDDSGYDIGS